MPQVICPQCGAKNDTRGAEYPFCVDCRDNLAKCGFCRWFDAETGACTHPVVAGIFQVSESATPPCVYHTPVGAGGITGQMRRALIWALVVTVIVALGFGLSRLRGPPPKPTLGLAVEADYEGAVVGEPFPVTATISNTSNVLATDVRFEIAVRSLEDFEIESVDPKPLATAERGKWQVLSYRALRPGARRRILLHTIPRRSGSLHLVVRLVSSGNLYHGMTDLLVISEPAPGEGEDQPPLEDEER